MKIISREYLLRNEITSDTRLLVKKTGVYLEETKPNLFVRIWRKLTGQYNKCKIARKAVEIFAKESLVRVMGASARNHYLNNLDGIVDKIPVTNSKCRQVYRELHAKIEALRARNIESSNHASSRSQRTSAISTHSSQSQTEGQVGPVKQMQNEIASKLSDRGIEIISLISENLSNDDLRHTLVDRQFQLLALEINTIWVNHDLRLLESTGSGIGREKMIEVVDSMGVDCPVLLRVKELLPDS